MAALGPYNSIMLLVATLTALITSTHGFSSICYWTVWSQGRPGDYGLKPGKIDPYLCTHLVYAFGQLGPELTVDLDAGNYPAAPSSVRTLNNLKNVNKNLVTLISIGGASKQEGALLPVVENQNTLETFAANAVKFCREWKFDGIDVDWEFPENGTSFTLLLQAVRRAFDQETLIDNRKRLILTAALAVDGDRIMNLYDIPALNQALDYFNIMAYNFHGSWGGFAGFNTPLYSRLSNPRFFPELSADWVITQYINRGASASKLILGLASYGRAYKLEDRTQHAVGAPITTSEIKGPVLEEFEYRMLPEICDFINDERARFHYDDEQKSAFVYTIDFWIGFDNTWAFHEKTKYAMDKNLGGVLIWTLDFDDVEGNHCNQGTFPLAKAVRSTIEGRNTLIPREPLKLYEPLPNLLKPEPSTDQYRRVCYFTNWSTKRSSDKGQFNVGQIQPETCTHLIYAYAFVDEVGLSVLPFQAMDESVSNRLSDMGMFEKFNDMKRHQPNLKTLLSIGGTTAGTRAFDIISRDDMSRRKFADNLVTYLETWSFDGVEINWVYPGNPSATKRQFTFLLEAIREAFDNFKAKYKIELILAIAGSARVPYIQNGYEIDKIAGFVDFINLKSYTYTRSDNVTFFSANLKKSASDPESSQQNQQWSVDQWINGGAPAKKINLGLAGYGLSFMLDKKTQTAPGSRTTGLDIPGPILGSYGFMTQYEICDLLKQGATVVVDSEQVAAYAYLHDLWVGYDNTDTLRQKMQWLKNKGLGGFSFWSIDYDDFNGTHCGCGQYPLLETALDALAGRNNTCSTETTTPYMIPVETEPTRRSEITKTTVRKEDTPRIVVVKGDLPNFAISLSTQRGLLLLLISLQALQQIIV